MNSPIIYQAVFGVLFLVFCYLTYMFTRTWRWPHATVCFLLFFTAMVFCYLAARTAATHMAWKEQHRKLSERLEREVEQRHRLRYGDPKLPVQNQPSIRTLQARLNRTVLDRGRVWRNCTPAQADGNTITLSTADPAATEPVPNRIAQGAVLYAFVETSVAEGSPLSQPPLSIPVGTKVPQYYIGEFAATAVTDNQVTLTWTIPPLTNYERTVLNNLGGKTVAMYDTMPVDGHRLFATNPNEKVNLGLDASEEPIFGDMDEEFIRALFEPYRGSVGDAWDEMIEPYLRDGGRAAESDPPEDRWAKVEFLTDHAEPVDSAGEPLGGVTQSESFFDGQGQANVPLVRRGGDGEAQAAEFKAGDRGVFPLATAQRLAELGICEIGEQIYVRDLHNYDYAFRMGVQQLLRLARELRTVERNISAVTESTGRVETQITFRRQEVEKVRQDLEKYRAEREKMTAYVAALEQQHAERKSQLSDLYQSNLQLAAELERLSETLRRSAPSATTGGG